jgi:hypothetical protein
VQQTVAVLQVMLLEGRASASGRHAAGFAFLLTQPVLSRAVLR